MRSGVVVVAAVGNGASRRRRRGRTRLSGGAAARARRQRGRRDGAVPAFSNRDAVYNDLAAPGEDIFSTVPRDDDRDAPGLRGQGYSTCGPTEFRNAEGTSFAAPQVAAAAALLFAPARPRARAGRRAARAHRRRREPGDRLQPVPAPARRAAPAGGGSTSPRALAARRRRRSRRPTASSRTTTPAPQAQPSTAARADDRGDARLLGRPDRRLRDLRCARASGSSCTLAAAPARRHALSLWKPGHEDASRACTLDVLASARALGRVGGAASGSSFTAPAEAAGTTSQVKLRRGQAAGPYTLALTSSV